MARRPAQRITKKQAKAQINHFGRSLIIYTLLFTALWHGRRILEARFPETIYGYDGDIIMLSAFIVLLILVTLIPFRISMRFLKLDIKDYLKKPDITWVRTISLACIGIAIQMVVIYITSYFSFFFRSASIFFDFVGNFRTTNLIIKNVLYFVFLVIVKPVCDEYIFRGLIQRQLGHYGRYFAVLASAFLYAICSPNLVEAIPAFFIGWYLALITLRYHSIRPAISVHIAVSLFLWLAAVWPDRYAIAFAALVVIIYIISIFTVMTKFINPSIAGKTGKKAARLWKILLSTSSVIILIIIFIANVILSLFY